MQLLDKGKSNTAILIFAHTTVDEQKQKTLLPNVWHNNHLLKYLNNKTEAIVEKTCLPYFIINEQRGSLFGERLGYAVQSVFDQGFDHVIAIGNDCPQLTSQQLLSAAQHLKEGKSVLGPDNRNGAYLIGIQRDNFEYNQFAALRWKTKYTAKDLEEYLNHVISLETISDLNSTKDLTAYLRIATNSFQAILYQIINNQEFHSFNTSLQIRTKPSSSNLHRGPPAVYLIK